jgi:predicted MFS family arabinose efflux permease
VASGFLIDAVGHRITFAAVFALLATALALLFAQRHHLPPHDAPARSAEPGHPFELLLHSDVRAVLIVSGLISMGWDMQSFLIPIYGSSVGLAASQIGLVLGSFAAATFVIRLAMPALSRRYREWQVLLFTLLASAIAFALMPLFSTMLPLMAVAFLLGLGLGSAQPNVMSLLHDRAPHGRVGEALGLRTTIMNSSHVVLPLVIGAFGSVLGTAAGFWLMAAGLSGGAWNARQRMRVEHQRTPS